MTDGAEYVLVIAEAGVNHNGSLDLAIELVDAAAEAGADIVKFQTFCADALATLRAPKAEYQRRSTLSSETQHGMLQRLELSEEAHKRLIARCEKVGIEFMSTPFDLGSVSLLLRLGVRRIKIGSGDLTNAPLLFSVARSNLPLIVSTGMATLRDIESSLGVLAFGMLGGENPSRTAFAKAWSSTEGRNVVSSRVTLLHCTTEYPAPIGEVNLRAMSTLRDTFGLNVGYSDHTEGSTVAIAAAALGATVIEKHLTLDRDLPGPDHAASLEPPQFAALVDAVRDAGRALGSSGKSVTPSEAGNIVVARKSLVALRPIAEGEPFTPENLGAKRPGDGVSPIEYWEWLGRPSPRAFAPNELIVP
ncbi:MAG: N-acetylneuraminate synthase [Gemmatimonadota bacterium]|nr:N-acetylneuraminate synthase [Gemmatimonadota bacterium]